jgi:hypothetical protein
MEFTGNGRIKKKTQRGKSGRTATLSNMYSIMEFLI